VRPGLCGVCCHRQPQESVKGMVSLRLKSCAAFLWIDEKVTGSAVRRVQRFSTIGSPVVKDLVLGAGDLRLRIEGQN
jgi:hypothetical protein